MAFLLLYKINVNRFCAIIKWNDKDGGIVVRKENCNRYLVFIAGIPVYKPGRFTPSKGLARYSAG